MPSATSSAIDPVGITSIGTADSSPRRMTEPLPNCRSIWASAASRALSLSPALSGAGLPLGAMRTPCRVVVRFRSPTLRATTDISGSTARTSENALRTAYNGPDMSTIGERLFERRQDTPACSIEGRREPRARSGTGLAEGVGNVERVAPARQTTFGSSPSASALFTVRPPRFDKHNLSRGSRRTRHRTALSSAPRIPSAARHPGYRPRALKESAGNSGTLNGNAAVADGEVEY